MAGGFRQANSATPANAPLTPEDMDRLGAAARAVRTL